MKTGGHAEEEMLTLEQNETSDLVPYTGGRKLLDVSGFTLPK